MKTQGSEPVVWCHYQTPGDTFNADWQSPEAQSSSLNLPWDLCSHGMFSNKTENPPATIRMLGRI